MNAGNILPASGPGVEPEAVPPDTTRLWCFTCNKAVTTPVPKATVFRGIATCPECIEAHACEECGEVHQGWAAKPRSLSVEKILTEAERREGTWSTGLQAEAWNFALFSLSQWIEERQLEAKTGRTGPPQGGNGEAVAIEDAEEELWDEAAGYEADLGLACQCGHPKHLHGYGPRPSGAPPIGECYMCKCFEFTARRERPTPAAEDRAQTQGNG